MEDKEDKLNKLLNDTKYIAYRGASWKYPENSFGAISLSLFDEDTEAVLVDVRMTKDGKLVTRNDDFMFTTSSSLKKVSEMTLEELQNVQVKYNKKDYFNQIFGVIQDLPKWYSKQQLELLKRLPLKKNMVLELDEVLKYTPDNKKILLNIKYDEDLYNSDKYSKNILETINNYRNKNININGDDIDFMMKLKGQQPQLQVGINIGDDLCKLRLPLDYVCIDLKRINYQINHIINSMEMDNFKEYDFCKVNSYREMKLYMLLLDNMAEQELTNQVGIMSNHIESSKALVKSFIKK